jgi:hypothetical protein
MDRLLTTCTRVHQCRLMAALRPRTESPMGTRCGKLTRRNADAMRASKSGRGEARLVAQHCDKFVLAMRSERFDKRRNNALRSLPEPRARVAHA